MFPSITKAAVLKFAGKLNSAFPPDFNLAFIKLTGLKVVAGPFSPLNSPAITSMKPFSPKSTFFISEFLMAWYFGGLILSFAGRFTHSCTIWKIPPSFAHSVSWNSLCKTPEAAVIHCTSPCPMIPPPPELSPCSTRP